MADIDTQTLEYTAGGTRMKGFLACPRGAKELPGVLVAPEWWGQDDYIRGRARQLAELGYAALALDMYGEGKTAEHPSDAQQFSSAVMENVETAKSRFLAAADVLKSHETVDESDIAAIGYCFGGGVVLHMARLVVDIDGVVSFHGSLGTRTPAEEGAVKAAILVCHGEDDPFVPPDAVHAFMEEMQEADADYKFIAYPGARHSFTSPGADEKAEEFGMNGLGYDQDADEESWAEMQRFFHKIFAD